MLPTIERRALASKVGRRVVMLFVLSALAPVILLSLLAFGYISNQLIEQSRVELDQLAKAQATHLYERILGVQRELRTFSRDARPRPPSAGFATHASDRFDGIVRVEFGAGPVTLFGEPPPVPTLSGPSRAHLAAGGTLLATAHAPGAGPRVLMLSHTPDAKALLVASVAGTALWQFEETLPYGVAMCVLGAGHRALFCSSEAMPEGWLDAVPAPGAELRSGPAVWTTDDQRYVVASKTLFLESNFGVSHWTVATARPAADALASAGEFLAIIAPVVVLVVLVVALLSIAQIRRTMVPLDRLREGTRKLAIGDFGSRIEVSSADEFEELADSFNDMAQRLGRQFGALNAMTDIDRLILSSGSPETIVEAALSYLRVVVGCELTAVTLLEGESCAEGRTYTARHLPEPAWAGDIGPDDAASLRNCADLWMVEPGNPRPAFVASLAGDTVRSIAIVPVRLENATVAAFSLGFAGNARLTPEALPWVNTLSDHMAVALDNARRERRLYEQAHYDPLTRLPNRLLLQDCVDMAIARCRRSGGALAVMFVDLDRFKSINDSYGHGTGDRLLGEVARRLASDLRESDTVARFGGDEFIVLAESLSSDDRLTGECASISEKIIASLSDPVLVDGRELRVSASVGIATYPRDGEDVDALFKGADSAMYHAKEHGGATFQFYSEERNLEARERLELEHGLHRALSGKELELYYQPQICARTGAVLGAEALVRWNHPERGLLLPMRFLPAAVESGQILDIGEWVLRRACEQNLAWQREGLDPIRMAINLSSTQFLRTALPCVVERVLADVGLEPRWLDLEITEDALLHDVERTRTSLDALNRQGVRVTLDGFGTGYSSLSYLRTFRIDALKVDRSFIQDIRAGATVASIVSTIIALAHNLGLAVVAEGIEDEAQRDYVIGEGCDALQGYLFSVPMPAADFGEFLRTHAPRQTFGDAP